MYMVGNKRDLSQEREVDFGSARMIAEQENCIAMETSAKEADNVENLFMSLATQLKRNVKNVEGNETKDNPTADENGTTGVNLGGHSICARGPLSCCRV